MHKCISENIIISEIIVLLSLRDFDSQQGGTFVSGGHMSIILIIYKSKIMPHIYSIQHSTNEGNIFGE